MKGYALLFTLLIGAGCYAQEIIQSPDVNGIDRDIAARNKIRTCTVIDSTAEGITPGDYMVFDQKGRILRKDLRESGRGALTIYAYDTVAHAQVLVTELNGPKEFTPQPSLRNYDRDSVFSTSSVSKKMKFRGRDEIETVYYGDDGRPNWMMIPKYDKNDSVIKTTWIEEGFTREIWDYRPDGTLITDSSFQGDDYSELTVEYFDKKGNIIKTADRNSDGSMKTVSTHKYKYDSKNRILEDVEKDESGSIDGTIKYTWYPDGTVKTKTESDRSGRILHTSERIMTISKGDTIITVNDARYTSSANTWYCTKYVTSHSSPMNYSARQTKYVTDAHHNIVGDTAVNLVLYCSYNPATKSSHYTQTEGKQVSQGDFQYDDAGHLLWSRFERDNGRTTDSMAYFPNGQVKIEVMSESGSVVSSEYDERGNLIHKSLGNPEIGMEHQLYIYTYDDQGLKLKEEIFEDGKRVVLRRYSYTRY